MIRGAEARPWGTCPPTPLRELLAQADPEQLIFGLDLPCNLAENTKNGLQTIAELSLDERAQRLIFGDNLREALGAALNVTSAQAIICRILRRNVSFDQMSTLEEIESAARRLDPADRQRLLVSVAQSLREAGHPLPRPRQFSVPEMQEWMDQDEQDMKRFKDPN